MDLHTAHQLEEEVVATLPQEVSVVLDQSQDLSAEDSLPLEVPVDTPEPVAPLVEVEEATALELDKPRPPLEDLQQLLNKWLSHRDPLILVALSKFSKLLPNQVDIVKDRLEVLDPLTLEALNKEELQEEPVDTLVLVPVPLWVRRPVEERTQAGSRIITTIV